MIEQELKCLGYYGFGGGYELGQGKSAPGAKIYCNACPLSTACWDSHRKRVAGSFPDATAEFDKLASAVPGPAAVQRWMAVTGGPDPYTMVFCGNIEDGVRVGGGGAPLDREHMTLSWPLKPLDDVGA